MSLGPISSVSFRVHVRELVDGRQIAGESYIDLVEDATIRLGREGDLVLGVDPPDPGISRTALTVRPGAEGWVVRMTNRNGASVHRWAQASTWLGHDSVVTLRWPRIGIRLAGGPRSPEHWVLLEADAFVLPRWASLAADPNETQAHPTPRDITATQMEAVNAVFSRHLAWPPDSAPASRSLEAAAHRLGVTPSAIRERLKPVQQRAQELGLHQQVGVTEPDYIYHLAAHGYLTPVQPALAVSQTT